MTAESFSPCPWPRPLNSLASEDYFHVIRERANSRLAADRGGCIDRSQHRNVDDFDGRWFPVKRDQRTSRQKWYRSIIRHAGGEHGRSITIEQGGVGVGYRIAVAVDLWTDDICNVNDDGFQLRFGIADGEGWFSRIAVDRASRWRKLPRWEAHWRWQWNGCIRWSRV